MSDGAFTCAHTHLFTLQAPPFKKKYRCCLLISLSLYISFLFVAHLFVRCTYCTYSFGDYSYSYSYSQWVVVVPSRGTRTKSRFFFCNCREMLPVCWKRDIRDTRCISVSGISSLTQNRVRRTFSFDFLPQRDHCMWRCWTCDPGCWAGNYIIILFNYFFVTQTPMNLWSTLFLGHLL